MIFEKLQNMVRLKIWKMDIHPSASIASSVRMDRKWPTGIHIEAHAVVQDEVVLLAHDMVTGEGRKTTICTGAKIGPRAIILPGVTIGANSIVMAGAVVTSDVAQGSVVFGNPARTLI